MFKKKRKNKIIISCFSAELPSKVEIDLTPEQMKALWVALETPYQKAMNREELYLKYGIKFN